MLLALSPQYAEEEQNTKRLKPEHSAREVSYSSGE